MVVEKKQAENPLESARLIQMLQTLSKEESKSFTRFLASPYHNTTEAILKFYQILAAYYPTFQPNDLTKGEIYQQVFDRDYDENQMNQLMTKTCRALEDFFAVEKLKKDELLTTKLKRDAFQQRQLSKQYTKASKQLQNLLEKEENPESNTYLERFLLNENLLYKSNLTQAEKEIYLKSILENLDYWYVDKKLKFSCFALNESMVKTGEYVIFNLDEIIKNYPHFDSVKIHDFYRNIILLQKDATELAPNFIENFEEMLSFTPEKEQLNLLRLLMNIFLKRYREGEKQMSYAMLDLYKIGLNRKILFYNRKLSHITFSNVVVSAIGCKQFVWAEEFIQDYQIFIDEFHQDAVNLAYGYLYYNKGLSKDKIENYSQALKRLAKVVNTKYFYQYRARCLQIRIFYELTLIDNEGPDRVLYFARAFRKHLKRKSELNQRKVATFINFINFTEKLVLTWNTEGGEKKNRLHKLRKEVGKTSPLFVKDWIDMKITELENQKGFL